MLPFNLHSSELLESLLGDSRVYSLTISPGNCPYNETDWKDIPSLNHPGYSVFVITGEHECFRDDILEWANHSLQSPLTPQKVIPKVVSIQRFISILETLQTLLMQKF